MTTTSAIQNVIAVLNANPPNLLLVQRWMFLARVQRAAKLGDVDAQRYMQLCELDTQRIFRH